MTLNGFEIREMTAQDYDEVSGLWRNTEGVGLDDDADTREGIAAYLARNPGFSYVARQQSQIVGAVLCGHDGRRGYLHHLAVADPAPIIVGLVLFGVAHAFIYRWLSSSWPVGITARAWRTALLLFAMAFLFWEFFTPFNQFAEPIPLIALELVFWAVIALAEGFAMAAVFEWRGDNSAA